MYDQNVTKLQENPEEFNRLIALGGYTAQGVNIATVTAQAEEDIARLKADYVAELVRMDELVKLLQTYLEKEAEANDLKIIMENNAAIIQQINAADPRLDDLKVRLDELLKSFSGISEIISAYKKLQENQTQEIVDKLEEGETLQNVLSSELKIPVADARAQSIIIIADFKKRQVQRPTMIEAAAMRQRSENLMDADKTSTGLYPPSTEITPDVVIKFSKVLDQLMLYHSIRENTHASSTSQVNNIMEKTGANAAFKEQTEETIKATQDPKSGINPEKDIKKLSENKHFGKIVSETTIVQQQIAQENHRYQQSHQKVQVQAKSLQPHNAEEKKQLGILKLATDQTATTIQRDCSHISLPDTKKAFTEIHSQVKQAGNALDKTLKRGFGSIDAAFNEVKKVFSDVSNRLMKLLPGVTKSKNDEKQIKETHAYINHKTEGLTQVNSAATQATEATKVTPAASATMPVNIVETTKPQR